MCECHDSEDAHDEWMETEMQFWRAEIGTEEPAEPPCICGHGIEWHKHIEDCRFDSCGCKDYRPS